MKKIVLLALVAVAAVACKSKVAPVVEAPAPAVIDSIVLVDGLGEVVSEVFGADIAVSETVPQAQVVKTMLHHQNLAKDGVYETTVTVKNADGTESVTTDMGRWTLDETGEFPVYSLKAFGDNTATFFWALKNGAIELLNADKTPLAVPYVLLPYSTTPENAAAEAAAAAEVAPAVEAPAAEAAPAN